MTQPTRWTVRILLALALSLLLVQLAHAQTSEGRFQLGFASSLVSYSKLSADLAQGPTDILTQGSLRASTTTIGPREDLALQLGYGAGRFLVIGALTRLGRSTTEYRPMSAAENETKLERSALFLAPTVAVMFLPAMKVRPTLELAVGYASSSAKTPAVDASDSGLQLEGHAGLRCFAAERFSIDPAVVVTWATSSGDFLLPDLGEKLHTSGSRWGIALALGISGWL